jgi:hypothetical protein
VKKNAILFILVVLMVLAMIVSILKNANSTVITRLHYPLFQAFNSTGAPLSGGLLYTFSNTNCTTAKTTYSDYALTTPNTNPVVLDSRGEADVFFTGAMCVTLADSTGTTVWQKGDVYGVGLQVLDEDDLSSNSDTAVPSQQSVKAYADALLSSLSTTSQTGSYTVTTSNEGSILVLTDSASSDSTFTLPQTDSNVDGDTYGFYNNSGYAMKIVPHDENSSVWNAGEGEGISLLDKGSFVMLYYNDTTTKWLPLYHSGGRCILNGLHFYGDFDNGGYDYHSTDYILVGDLSRQNPMTARDIAFSSSSATTKWGISAIYFDDAGDFARINKTTIPLLVSSTVDEFTFGCWVYFSALGTKEFVLSVCESNLNNDNGFELYKTAANAMEFVYESGGVAQISMSGGAVSATTWHHVAIIRKDNAIALYFDGANVARDTSWSEDTLDISGNSAYIGSDYNNANDMTGYVDDLVFGSFNFWNADPANASDTIASTTNSLSGITVMR